MVCRVMATAKWHTFQVLTKRSTVARLLSGRLRFAAEQDHIWWGVSVENKKHGLPRIADLQAAPARVRFLSIEPRLENLGQFGLSGISWAIVGGESGPGTRPMLEEWVTAIRDLCSASHVPFFFKQWGGVRKKKHGRLLQGRTYDEYPARVVSPIPEPARCFAYAESIRNSLRAFSDHSCSSQHRARRSIHEKTACPCVFLRTNSPAYSRDSSTWLSSLPQAKDYVQHRSSSYDRSGGNADARTIAPGETLTLLDDAGPGRLCAAPILQLRP